MVLSVFGLVKMGTEEKRVHFANRLGQMASGLMPLPVHWPQGETKGWKKLQSFQRSREALHHVAMCDSSTEVTVSV